MEEGRKEKRRNKFANSTGGSPENTLDVWRHLGSFFFFLLLRHSPRTPPDACSSCFCYLAHTNSSRAARRARSAWGEIGEGGGTGPEHRGVEGGAPVHRPVSD